MLIDTKPQAFSDLVRIAGLAHGTDVWLGNALNRDMTCGSSSGMVTGSMPVRSCSIRIMVGSFTIMESVRKGKGLKPEMEAAMEAANVPDWYIWSCKNDR